MGSGLFLVNSCRHLGLSSLDCSVLMLLLLLRVLAARLCVWVFGLPFGGNPPGGRMDMGQPGGGHIFFGFSHNQGVWVKTATALNRGN